MPSDRERWNARHAAAAGQTLRPPDPFVVQVLDELGPGGGRFAIDLACGTGRHALALAERGRAVEAWDVSAEALAQLPPGAPGAQLVVVVNFLDRGLFARLASLLAPGGSAVIATFTRDFPEPHPSPRFRLERGELTHDLPGLERLRAVEGGGRAGLWARRREDW